MAHMSPHFSFLEYWSYNLTDQGNPLGPYYPSAGGLRTPGFHDPRYTEPKYLYILGEREVSDSDGDIKPTAYADDDAVDGTPWKLEHLCRLTVTNTNRLPCIEVANELTYLDSPIWGSTGDTLELPHSVDGGIRDKKYYALLSRWLLTEYTVSLLEGKKPDHLPVFSPRAEGAHIRACKFDSKGRLRITPITDPESVRVVMVVDPHSIAEHLAMFLEHSINHILRLTNPEAAFGSDGNSDKSKETVADIQTRKIILANQIDTLRQVNPDLNSRLKENGSELDRFLDDFNPYGDGELFRRWGDREKYAKGLIKWTESDLWNLMHEDATGSSTYDGAVDEERANQWFQIHFDIQSKCFQRLSESSAGTSYLKKQYAKNLPEGSGRPVPVTSNDFFFQEFIFPEKQLSDSWLGGIATQGANALMQVYLTSVKARAEYALEHLDEYRDGATPNGPLRPPNGFQQWILPKENASAFTVYRWVKDFKNTFGLETVELTGEIKGVDWWDHSGNRSVEALQFRITMASDEWDSVFGGAAKWAASFQNTFGVLSASFSLLALNEAIVHRRSLGTPMLKTAASFLSLADTPFMMGIFGRLTSAFGSSVGVGAARFLGFVGGGLGVYFSFSDGRDAYFNDGEVDVAIANGAALAGGLVVLASMGAALGLCTGPAGWLVALGYTLMFGGSLSAALLKDDEIEKIVEHCIFGKSHGQSYDAPPAALCAERNFMAWSEITPAVLDAQIRGFDNLIWGFSIQGEEMITKSESTESEPYTPSQSYPMVRIVPQCLASGCYFEVDYEMAFGQPSNRREIEMSGTVRLHVGDRQNIHLEQVSGDALEEDYVTKDKMEAVFILERKYENGTNHVIKWVLAPPASIREQMGIRAMTEATISVRFFVRVQTEIQFRDQKYRELIVPAPEPDSNYVEMPLEYQLVRPPELQKDFLGHLNQKELSSMDIYPSLSTSFFL